MSSHANELISEAETVRLLGRERFDRLTAAGYVIPTRKGGREYLASYVRLRLNEDLRLGGGPAVVVTKSHGRKDWRVQADIEGGGGPPQPGPGRDPQREKIADRYNTDAELERLRDLYDGKPGRGRIDPQVLAALYSHAKAEAAYIDQLGGRYGDTLGNYRRQEVRGRMEQLRALWDEHAPGEDLDKCCLKFEQDADGGMDPETGEAGLVSAGHVPPENKRKGRQASPAQLKSLRAVFDQTLVKVREWVIKNKIRETIELMEERYL